MRTSLRFKVRSGALLGLHWARTPWRIALAASLVAVAACGGGGGGGSDSNGGTPAPTVSLSASAAMVASGATTTLSWNSTNATSCTASGGWSGTRATSGSEVTSAIAANTTFSLTCTGQGGSGSANATVGVQAATSQTMPMEGGTLSFGDITITARQGDLVNPVSFAVSTTTTPAALPQGFELVGDPINIAVSQSDAEKVNGPMSLTWHYEESEAADEDKFVVLHYSAQLQGYELARVNAIDAAANTITFESREFSPFLLVRIIEALLPSSTVTADFTPATNGWNVKNFQSYFASGGNCLGMSAYAVWFKSARPQESLATKFPNTEIAKHTIMRAHLAQNQTWAKQEWQNAQQLGDMQTARAIKASIGLLHQPLILILGTTSPKHADVVYGYDATGFLIYEVNAIGTTAAASQRVPFNGTAFGAYNGFNKFGYVGRPSTGRTEDFAALTTDAEGGFQHSDNLQIASPAADATIAARQTTLQGTVAGNLDPNAVLLAYVKGQPQMVPVQGGAFTQTIPVYSGVNSLIVVAGVDILNQSNFYKNAATLFRDFNGSLPASELVITLTWGQNESDVDLYVTDPSGGTAWYGGRRTGSGLELDFDNTAGFGPEHITLTATGASAGTVLPGQYRIRAHYFAGQTAVSGTIKVIIREGSQIQQYRDFPFSISTSNAANASPGAIGADWVNVANVDIVNNQITQ